MKFEWDDDKDLANQEKHGLSFDDASKVFETDFEITYDKDHSSHDEDRYIATGTIPDHGKIMVVHCEVEWEDEETIRIISARKV